MKHQAEEREEQRLAEQRAANDAKLAAKDAIIADLQQRLKEHEQVGVCFMCACALVVTVMHTRTHHTRTRAHAPAGAVPTSDISRHTMKAGCPHV